MLAFVSEFLYKLIENRITSVFIVCVDRPIDSQQVYAETKSCIHLG